MCTYGEGKTFPLDLTPRSGRAESTCVLVPWIPAYRFIVNQFCVCNFSFYTQYRMWVVRSYVLQYCNPVPVRQSSA